jgi:hypothetical protein
MANVASLTLALADRQELKALFEQSLSKGRAFVRGATGVQPLEACALVLAIDGRRHELRAEAVFVKDTEPGCGVGLQLAPLDATGLEALRAFVDGETDAATGVLDVDKIAGRDAEPEAQEGDEEVARATTLHDRVRGLSHAEQQRLAASGSMSERIALERAFGANVWEALLGNPRLTIPEVAKIARKGTLPRPLVENIAGHASWLTAPEVQRALLGNPRSTAGIVTKVLASMSRSELLLVPQQTAYPQAVRMQARKLLGQGK